MVLDRKFSVAPMLDWTTRHTRYFFRLFSQRMLQYTEMVTTGALIHGDQSRFLTHRIEEYPLAIQLGGSNPAELAYCTELSNRAGFQEVNLNVGCPSDRVQSGMFGACLMAKPSLVKDCVSQMIRVSDCPVTVKCRLGIDHQDNYEFVRDFIATVAESGCNSFTIHARKAWLSGLSPKQNRDIPPLQYERVYQLKKEFPQIEFIINGGIKDYSSIKQHLENVDGVMVGREVFQNPAFLADVDSTVYGAEPQAFDRASIVEAYRQYMMEELDNDIYLRHLCMPLMGLFQGIPGTKAFKRHLSENMHKSGAGISVFDDALAYIIENSIAA